MSTSERGVLDRSTGRGARKVPRKPLVDRCYQCEITVPETYAEFERKVEEWVATCVTSRTNEMHRERILVPGNPTLKPIWQKVRWRVGTVVTIAAEYTMVEGKAQAVRFQYIEVTKPYVPIATAPEVAPEFERGTFNQFGFGVWVDVDLPVGAPVKKSNRYFNVEAAVRIRGKVRVTVHGGDVKLGVKLSEKEVSVAVQTDLVKIYGAQISSRVEASNKTGGDVRVSLRATYGAFEADIAFTPTEFIKSGQILALTQRIPIASINPQGWKFGEWLCLEGSLTVFVEIKEAPTLAAYAEAARLARVVVTRPFVAPTAVGTAAVVTSIAMLLDLSHEGGRQISVAQVFAEGYVEVLNQLLRADTIAVGNHLIPSQHAKYPALSIDAFDWKMELNTAGTAFIKNRNPDRNLLDTVRKCGRAAVLQQMQSYYEQYGEAGYQWLCGNLTLELRVDRVSLMRRRARAGKFGLDLKPPKGE